MRILAARVLALLGLALVLGALGSVVEPPALVASLALAAVTAVALAAVVVLVVLPVAGARGGRARQHRQVLVGMPAPQHPATPGRTRSRAPGGAVPAA